MTQTVYPGESAAKWVDYVAPGINLAGSTILIALGAYGTEPATWETPAGTDFTNAATGTIRASIADWDARPTGWFWVWTQVTTSGGTVDVTVYRNERIEISSGTSDTGALSSVDGGGWLDTTPTSSIDGGTL